MLQEHVPREYARIASLMAAQATCFHQPWWTLETSKDLSIFTNIVHEHIGWTEEELEPPKDESVILLGVHGRAAHHRPCPQAKG